MCVPDDDMLHHETFVYRVNECNATCATCEEGLTCAPKDQDCVDPVPQNADNLNNWKCTCRSPSTGEAVVQAATCTLDECLHGGGTVCGLNSQGCEDHNKTVVGEWNCTCAGNALPYDVTHGSEHADNGVESLAECYINECAGATGQPGPGPTYRVCDAAGQECIDPNWDESSPDDWMCYCPGSPRQSELRGPVENGTGPFCEPVDECVDESTAAMSMRHIPRFAADGCLCGDRWSTNHSGVVDGEPGSMTNPCVSGCCNPDDDTHGEWCILDTSSSYNTARGCSAVWGYCLPAGMLPPGTAALLPWNRVAGTPPGVSSMESNLCTDAGQFCRDDDAANGTWYCDCVPDEAAAHGSPQYLTAPTECILDECIGVTLCSDQDPVQLCNDTNKHPNATDDWECQCTVGPANATSTGAATCTLNECENTCATCVPMVGPDNFCEANGQECIDDNTTASSTGDWRCHCVSPNTAVAGATPVYGRPGTAAECELDECTAVCLTCENNGTRETCADAGQNCTDVDTRVGSTEDWVCNCLPPHALPGDVPAGPEPAEAAATHCVIFECDNVCPTCELNVTGGTPHCEAVGQDCHDPDPSVLSDWYCTCRLPERGSDGVPVKDGGNATASCSYNPCTDHSSPRCLADQACVVMNNTWYCECILPDTPVGNATFREQAANCTAVGECVSENGTGICSAAGQHCRDDTTINAPTAGAWWCDCIVDGAVNTTAGSAGDQSPANCTLNECEAGCADCENGFCDTYYGQTCRDLDQGTAVASLGTWECVCASGTGTAGRPATGCTLDECTLTGISDPNATCANEGQDCRDDDQTRDGGWKCVCRGGSTDERPEAAVLTCTVNECANATNNATCTGQGQVCKDHNETEVDTWYCHCPDERVAPSLMSNPNCDAYNECTKVCPSGCAATDNTGTVCSKQDPPQTCEDPLPYDDQDNWICVCALPATGSGPQRAARPDECALNECNTTCTTCANRGAGDVCVAAGQVCEDTTQHLGGVEDWTCKCPAPLDFLSATNATVPLCEFDECTETKPGDTGPVGADACAGQACFDTGLSRETLGTFRCVCNGTAEVGEKSGAKATCRVDECELHGTTCTSVMFYGRPETCFDVNETVTDDWYCTCPNPAQQTNATNAAVCEYNECTDATIRDQCPSGQICVDEQLSTDDTWECRCIVKNGTVRAPGRPAVCEKNECDDHRSVCENANQTCTDDNQLEDGTWECSCNVGVGAPAVANVTTCTVPVTGDCLQHGSLCITNEQWCYDPDPATDGSDWECRCYVTPPTTRMAGVKGVAQCEVNECTEGGHSADCPTGQYCFDDNLKHDGDWMCLCNFTSLGTPGAQGPATCPSPSNGGCVDHEMECITREQYCFETQGTWACACHAPSELTALEKAVEKCTWNECTASLSVCPTCAGSTCPAGQDCKDVDELKPNTWYCECKNKPVNELMKKAECGFDECSIEANWRFCESGSPKQECVDTDMDSDETWTCLCRDANGQSHQGLNKELAPNCVHAGMCADANVRAQCGADQLCVDMGNASFECHCLHGLSGVPGNGTAADCGRDECSAERCVVHMGSTRATHPPGECPRAVCNTWGQDCVDPDVHKDNTWECRCPDGSDASKVHVVESCKRGSGMIIHRREDCTFMDCYWWVLLLLLLCCCCCIAALLLLLRRRKAHADYQDDKYNKHFAGPAGAIDAVELTNAEEEETRSEFKHGSPGNETDRSLLYGERETPRAHESSASVNL
eukprot:TRINITY_DN1681_c0_g1_i1.p1 TRINITY_DN1681_c0_g1~~TRINITY_DN1681_c0_g1_i1.p1  ORF type:complete len:1740 (+),score=351.88 TRINITY_DN1681_c0_g1_i1:1305-6524(+)